MTKGQRTILAGLMDYMVENAKEIHYKEARPMFSVQHIQNVTQLRAYFESVGGFAMDCSESVTLLMKLAGCHDPNGLSFNGSGYTGSLLGHLHAYEDPKKAEIGALVVFGPGTGEHVAMVRVPGNDPLLFSHGFEGGPIYTRLSDERAGHKSPVRFLDVSHL